MKSGELRLGSSIGRVLRQDLSQVPLDRTCTTSSPAAAQVERGRIQGHLGRFGFFGAGSAAPRRLIIGWRAGARSRSAILMLSCANLLVLDEPTNHLDVESIRGARGRHRSVRRHGDSGEP